MLQTSTSRALTLGALCYLIAALIFFPEWHVDDAYISLRYAQNLVEHGQLIWNVGQPPVEGYTGILWTLLLAGALWLRLPPLLMAHIVSLVSLAACLALVVSLVAQMGRPERRPLALAICAVSACLYPHVTSGLETLLFSALVLASILAFHRAMGTAMWLLLLLTSLTRPEGVALAGALFLAGWLRGDRVIGQMISLYALPGSIYFLWRWEYYGQFLPNTFYAKSAGGGWTDVRAFLSLFILPGLALWASKPTWAWAQHHRHTVASASMFVLTLVALYGSSELLMNYAHRFFIPIYLLAVVGLTTGLGDVRQAGFCLGGYALLNTGLLIIYAAWGANYQQMMRSEHQAAAAWIEEQAPVGATLAVIVDAGIVPYLTELRTIDFGALNDRYLAHNTAPGARVEYFFAVNPDIVLLGDGDMGIRAAEGFRNALLADERWSKQYRLGASFTDGRNDYHQHVYVRNNGHGE